MAIAKRILLFMAVNMLVYFTISILITVLGIHPFMQGYGIDYTQLMAFCLIWGMGGSLISLLLSKVMAKWMMGVQVIDPNTRDGDLQQLIQMVYHLARSAHLPKMPEVGIYDSPEVNAFATGPSKGNALVAVSTGLLQRMKSEEVEGVLGHEITHVANGDMVTMTLLQGIVNAFVMFLSNVIAFAIAQAMRGDREDREGGGMSGGVFYLVRFVLELVLMVLGTMVVMWFSRYREFRADAGGAKLAGRSNMIRALQALQRTFEIEDPATDKPGVQTFKISGHRGGFLSLFASHPPLDERIARLQKTA